MQNSSPRARWLHSVREIASGYSVALSEVGHTAYKMASENESRPWLLRFECSCQAIFLEEDEISTVKHFHSL